MAELDISRMFSVLEGNLRVREAQVEAKRLDLLIESAAEKGMETALESFGAGLSDADRAAFKALTPAELKTMVAVREKLAKADLVAHNFGGAIF